MCDYSLENLKSRPARVGDKLQATRFKDTITHGFCDASGDCNEAVCLLPGTELGFDEPIQSINLQAASSYINQLTSGIVYHNSNVAKFAQVDLDNPYAHHDAIELVSGAIVKVHNLIEGQTCTVLQLPVSEHVKENVTEEALLSA